MISYTKYLINNDIDIVLQVIMYMNPMHKHPTHSNVINYYKAYF